MTQGGTASPRACLTAVGSNQRAGGRPIAAGGGEGIEMAAAGAGSVRQPDGVVHGRLLSGDAPPRPPAEDFDPAAWRARQAAEARAASTQAQRAAATAARDASQRDRAIRRAQGANVADAAARRAQTAAEGGSEAQRSLASAQIALRGDPVGRVDGATAPQNLMSYAESVAAAAEAVREGSVIVAGVMPHRAARRGGEGHEQRCRDRIARTIGMTAGEAVQIGGYNQRDFAYDLRQQRLALAPPAAGAAGRTSDEADDQAGSGSHSSDEAGVRVQPPRAAAVRSHSYAR